MTGTRKLVRSGAVLLLILHVILLFLTIRANDWTYDEPLSIACGLQILEHNECSLNPESGRLPQVLSVLFLRREAFADPLPGNRFDRLTIAIRRIWSHPDPQSLLFQARLRMGFLSFFCALLIFVIAKEISGNSIWALLPLAVYAVSPLSLSYGVLANAD